VCVTTERQTAEVRESRETTDGRSGGGQGLQVWRQNPLGKRSGFVGFRGYSRRSYELRRPSAQSTHSGSLMNPEPASERQSTIRPLRPLPTIHGSQFDQDTYLPNPLTAPLCAVSFRFVSFRLASTRFGLPVSPRREAKDRSAQPTGLNQHCINPLRARPSLPRPSS
jgi:hypothetical protein